MVLLYLKTTQTHNMAYFKVFRYLTVTLTVLVENYILELVHLCTLGLDVSETYSISNITVEALIPIVVRCSCATHLRSLHYGESSGCVTSSFNRSRSYGFNYCT